MGDIKVVVEEKRVAFEGKKKKYHEGLIKGPAIYLRNWFRHIKAMSPSHGLFHKRSITISNYLSAKQKLS